LVVSVAIVLCLTLTGFLQSGPAVLRATGPGFDLMRLVVLVSTTIDLDLHRQCFGAVTEMWSHTTNYLVMCCRFVSSAKVTDACARNMATMAAFAVNNITQFRCTLEHRGQRALAPTRWAWSAPL